MPERDPLVSPEWLKARLDAPDIRVIDGTWFLPNDPRDARAEHAKARIPGAIFFDIDEIADTTSTLPHMLPPPEKFSSRMRKLGIGDGAQIVVYDAQGLFSAARVWWTFRVMGFDDVFVLDGGLPAWIKAGGAIEDGLPLPRSERHLTPRYRADLVRDLKDMRWAVETQRALILDARPRNRFTGDAAEPRPNLKAGHMPGVHSIPSTELLDERGFLKPREELEKIFADVGVSKRSRVVCTCGSGVTAAIIALALARIGRWDAPVYDGGWAEWGAIADTPVAVGDD